MRTIKLFFIAALGAATLSVSAQRQNTDQLDRGLIAVQTSEGVYCSWRIQADEYYDTQYNLYRNGAKVNDAPLSVSNLLVKDGTNSDTFTVRAIVRGVEQEASDATNVWSQNYLEIVPKHDTSLTSTYVPNDVCMADVDGDGELELLIKYDNQSEISASYPKNGYNGEYSLFECMKLDGTVLWWVNCGPNMGDFQNNEQNIVAYDWDGDCRAECVFRAADGTTIHLADGSTYVVGDASLNYRAATGGGTNWFMHSGAEFLLYVDGQTGKPYQCLDYPLPRLEESENPRHLLSGSAYDDLVKNAWGDGYGHRSSKHFFGAPYLDGQKPSIFLGRGIYTRHKFVAFDVNSTTHELVQRWRWDCNSPGPWYGQGYHNYSIADVDWDGRDEIIFGSMVIDDNGLGLSTTGLGHGDAHHVADLNPYIHGQEVFACNEDLPDNNYRDATTSKIYYRQTSPNDDGRSLAGNFCNDFPGAMGYSGHDTPISCVVNDHISGLTNTGVTLNFRIYWDGDLQEESFNGSATRNSTGQIFKYGQANAIATLKGSITNNDTKATPCYQGDILGDWREEVIMRTSANNIRIYTSTDPTPWRNYSLWYDHQYRNAMVWQMCGYNQPPHVSYFLGELENITIAPPPLTTVGREVVAAGGTISTSFNDKHVLVSENADATVSVAAGASPYITTFYVPSWVQGTAPSECTTQQTDIVYDYYRLDVTGEAFTGAMRLVKQGDGILTLPNVEQTYSGPTDIWAGTLNFDGSLKNSRLWLNRFAELNSDGGRFATIQADYASVIRPGGADKVGVIEVDSLLLGFGSRIVFDITDANNYDQVRAQQLVIEKKDWKYGPQYSAPVLEFVCSQTPTEGDYVLISTEGCTGDVANLVVEGLKGVKYNLTLDEGKVVLHVLKTRAAEDVAWTGAVSSIWDLDNTPNFSSSTHTFVTGDNVTFGDDAVLTEVNVAEELSPGSVTFLADSKEYKISGSGAITGNASVTLQGAGTVNMGGTHTYTGGTFVHGGALVPALLANKDGVAFGSVGGVNDKIELDNRAVLRTSSDMTTSQPIVIGTGGGTLEVSGGTLILNGSLKKTTNAGKGNIYKEGRGTLQLECAPTFDTLFINGGTVYDFGDNHFGSRVIEFNGGTLRYNNSIYSSNTESARFVVPEGQEGTLYPDGRCDYTGALTGGGTFNVHATWVRLYFNGNWSAFTGTIKAYQDGKVGSYTPTFEFNNTYGLGKATLNIQSGCTVHTNGKNFAIGELTGSGSIDNKGEKSTAVNTLSIGGKDTDFAFGGTIVGSKVDKVGSGTWTVSNTNCLADAGSVTISSGTLKLNSRFATATMTGSSVLTIKNGASITGRGVVQSLTLNSGASLQPGIASSPTSNVGTVKALGNLNAQAGSDIYLNMVNNANSDNSRSWVECAGTLTLNGTLHLSLSPNYSAADGDSTKLIVAETIDGTPTFDLPDLPEGLSWDTSTLMQDGVIRVTSGAGIQQVTADLGQCDCYVYDIAGKLVATITDCNPSNPSDLQSILHQQRLASSVYLVRLNSPDGVKVRRVILK